MARYYKKDDKKYVSVTTVISDCTDSSGALTQWSANMCKEWILENCAKTIDNLGHEYNLVFAEDLDEMRFNFRKVSQKALDIGSQVHNAIEMHLQDKPFTLTTPEAKNSFDAFLGWAKDGELKPIGLEQTVYGNRWAGTCDFYGYYKGKIYVIDWKSSKAHYPEMRYQVAAYRSCLKDVEGSGILRLDKETGLPDWKDHSKTYLKDLNVFHCMVNLYFARHPRIAKQFDSIIPF